MLAAGRPRSARRGGLEGGRAQRPARWCARPVTTPSAWRDGPSACSTRCDRGRGGAAPGPERVMVSDWDVQPRTARSTSSAAGRDVLYLSRHLPLLPGHLSSRESATGPAHAPVNCPAAAGPWRRRLWPRSFMICSCPRARRFRPDIVIVSAALTRTRATRGPDMAWSPSADFAAMSRRCRASRPPLRSASWYLLEVATTWSLAPRSRLPRGDDGARRETFLRRASARRRGPSSAETQAALRPPPAPAARVRAEAALPAVGLVIGAPPAKSLRRLLALNLPPSRWIRLVLHVRLLIARAASSNRRLHRTRSARAATGRSSTYSHGVWWFHGDAALFAAPSAGAALAIAGAGGCPAPAAVLCAVTPPLFSATRRAGRTFLSFHGDHLRLEVRPARQLLSRLISPLRSFTFLFRCVLFKLYIKKKIGPASRSGQSPISRLARAAAR